MLGKGASALHFQSQQLSRSNRRRTEIARTGKQTSLCLQHNPYIISYAKVKVDLIFCLVLIKQLLHYLIFHNQVKEKKKSGGVGGQLINIWPPKAFEQRLANLGNKCTLCWRWTADVMVKSHSRVSCKIKICRITL